MFGLDKEQAMTASFAAHIGPLLIFGMLAD